MTERLATPFTDWWWETGKGDRESGILLLMEIGVFFGVPAIQGMLGQSMCGVRLIRDVGEASPRRA